MRTLRVLFKLALLRLGVRQTSFCKECGRDVRDFQAPDWTWEKVAPHIPLGNVLCYTCFCDYCERLDIYPVWILVHPLE